MEESYGKPIAIERELPFCFSNAKGQIVNGAIDLIYRTEKGDVLVDYKTYQGAVTNLTDADNDFYAGKYCGQIALYEEALKRDGRNVIKRLICYLSLGVIISFE
jgi:ATP-dependent exoDNAse (exonuclease V) beta subunit